MSLTGTKYRNMSRLMHFTCKRRAMLHLTQLTQVMTPQAQRFLNNDSELPELISSDEEEAELYSAEAGWSDTAYSDGLPDTYTVDATQQHWRPMPFGLPLTSMTYPETPAPLGQSSSATATGIVTPVEAEAEVSGIERESQRAAVMEDRTNTLPGPPGITLPYPPCPKSWQNCNWLWSNLSVAVKCASPAVCTSAILRNFLP